MTLDELDKMQVEFLDIPTVSKYLNKDPGYIRNALRQGVPWGYSLGSSDYRIPRRAFVSYHKNGYVGSEAHPYDHELSKKRHLDIDEVGRKLAELNKQVSVILELIDRAGKLMK